VSDHSKIALSARALWPSILVATGALIAGTAVASSAAYARSVTVKLDGSINGAQQHVRGTMTFNVPDGWASNPDRFPSDAEFLSHEGACTIAIFVGARAVATRRTAANQVDAALPAVRQVHGLGRGIRSRGAWGLDEIDHSATSPPARGLYGIAPVKIETRRFTQIRAGAEFTGDCPDSVVDEGTTAAAFRDILRHATVHARVVRKHKR